MQNGRNSFKIFFILPVILLLANISLAQHLVPQLNLKSHWDGHDHSGSFSVPYNSLWGWTSDSGREYAILGSLDSIYFFDVTNPSDIKLCDARAGRFNNCVNREFKTYKNYCYAVADANNCSLQIFDLSYLPDSVHKVYDSDTLSSAAHSLFIDGDRLYLTWNKRIHPAEPGSTARNEPNDVMTLASLQNPEAPSFIANLSAPSDGNGHPQFDYVHDGFARNDTVYCCCWGAGLYIYNYKNPQNPVLLQVISGYDGGSQGFTHSCWLNPDGNMLVFTDETPAPVELYDVSALKTTSSQPVLRAISVFGSHTSLGGIGHNAYIKGKCIYMSYYEDGVVIFDMGDSTKVHEIASYDTYPENATGSYHGLIGCWNIYPYFPSGNIIASDMKNGLFVLGVDSISAINSNYINSNSIDIKIVNNPFQNDLHFIANADKPQNVNICLYDLVGKKLLESDYYFLSGKMSVSIPCPYIQNGVLIFKATTKQSQFTRKLIKTGY